MKKIVDAITEEGVSFGSILVARYWESKANGPYSLPSDDNVARIRKNAGKNRFELLNPREWSLDQLPKKIDAGAGTSCRPMLASGGFCPTYPDAKT